MFTRSNCGEENEKNFILATASDFTASNNSKVDVYFV